MKIKILLLLSSVFILLSAGLRMLGEAASGSVKTSGRRNLKRQAGWKHRNTDMWDLFPLRQLSDLAAQVVYLDEAAAERLESELRRAGMTITPRQFAARRWVIILTGGLLAVLSTALHFVLGAVISILLTVYGLMRERETVQSKVRKHELAIEREMPRFVHTLARQCAGNRDIENAVGMYRRIAGPEMSGELDILVSELRTGNIQSALEHFGRRIGTVAAFRLSSILRDLSTGVDQTASLRYLAEDLSRQSRENLRKELMRKPSKMRRTYYPAVIICVVTVMYVLVMYVVQSLNSIW